MDSIRTIFGYGPGTFPDIKIIGTHGGKDYYFWSADSTFLCFLAENGIFGFFAYSYLFMNIIWYVWRGFRRSAGAKRYYLMGILAGLISYIFILTNVYAYDYQVAYLFWIFVALSVILIDFERGPKISASR